MKIIIDFEKRELAKAEDGRDSVFPLYSPKAFEILSQSWVKVGWDQKYSYNFTWMGRPIIQLPEDLIRIQEVVYCLKPDVIIETGVAHGGSLIFFGSLCAAMGKGRVIGVDIEIRPNNRTAIESHELSPLITLVEGDSIEASTVGLVHSLVKKGEVVLIILDSCHAKKHVLAELEAYHPLVTPGSYIVASDGVMKDLSDVPGGNPDWAWDNPSAAAIEFAQNHTEFVLEQPARPFQESPLLNSVTYWPSAWLKRKE